MKPLATIIIGFIAGLVISGVLGDLIVAGKNSVGRVSSAWIVSRAERHVADGNFSQAEADFRKAVPKISPNNTTLLAKVKNNLALTIFTQAEKEGNKEKIEESIAIFSESLELYRQAGDMESIAQVKTNIEEAQKVSDAMEKA